MKPIQIELAGRFKFTAVNVNDGTERELTPWFDNLILDAGLNKIAEQGIGTHCSVGTGSTAPANGQTALVGLVYQTDNQTGTTTGYDSSGNLYAWVRRKFRFTPGQATGNLSEVGIGWNSGLFSRALIKDGAGDPTTITVLSDEYLDVTYELRTYRPAADSTYNVTISGVTYSVTSRAAMMSSWDASTFLNFGASYVGNTFMETFGTGGLGAVTGSPSGAQIANGMYAAFDGAYSTNSRERNIKFTAGLSQSNADIYAIQFYTELGRYQMSFTPPLPKTSEKMLTLNAKLSWARKTI